MQMPLAHPLDSISEDDDMDEHCLPPTSTPPPCLELESEAMELESVGSDEEDMHVEQEDTA